MRHDFERLRRVATFFGRQATPERQDGFIDSFGVVVGLHLEIPMERRPEPIRKADANQIHLFNPR